MKVFTLAVLVCLAVRAELRFEPRHAAIPAGERISGAALAEDGALVTWGDRALRWSQDGAYRELLPKTVGPFASAGALFDLDGDGLSDLILLESGSEGRLVWFRAPRWERRVIAEGIETPDALGAELYGRRGVLVVQKHIQVRFYEAAGNGRRDIYSFYTPSRQAGMKMADIDGDGRADILCGNYWIRNPADYELPWRLFAINLWSEAPESAEVRLTLAGGLLVASQGAVEDGGRLGWFEKPADPRKLWHERRADVRPPLRRPQALAAGDFDADGRPDFVVGENAGAGSRAIVFRRGSGFEPAWTGRTGGAFFAAVYDWNKDGRLDFVTVGPDAITWWGAVEAVRRR